MDLLLKNCRARFTLGLIASILLFVSSPSAHASVPTSKVDPMSFPASATGLLLKANSGDCAASVINTPGVATVVMAQAACVGDTTTSGLLYAPAAVGTFNPYGAWTVQSIATGSEVDLLTLAPRHGTSLKSLTGALGVSFAGSAQAVDTAFTTTGPTSALLGGGDARQLLASVGGDTSSSAPVPAPELHPKLWVHAKARGAWTNVTFGIEPDYPIEVSYRCTYDGHSGACGTGMLIKAGSTIKIEASYDVPGHLHLIGRRTIHAVS